MLQSAQGSLTIVDGRKVFWKGRPVPASSVMVHADEDSVLIKLRVDAAGPEPVYADMEAAGIKVRRA